MKRWFVTWNRPEYKEWAAKSPAGYTLLIIRKERARFLCVKAKLKMEAKGLPGFKIVEEKSFKTNKEVKNQIKNWMD